jgi:hypothetical protein
MSSLDEAAPSTYSENKTQYLSGYKPRNAEEKRLLECETKAKHWKRWGPYLSERQWV